MEQRDEVRIPPKRLRLLGIFSGCRPLYLPSSSTYCGSCSMRLASSPLCHPGHCPHHWDVRHHCRRFLTLSWSQSGRSRAWCSNLPVVILTPEGIVNHSIIYHVVVPWNEIEAFTRIVPETAKSSRHWWRMLDSDDDILVIAKTNRGFMQCSNQ